MTAFWDSFTNVTPTPGGGVVTDSGLSIPPSTPSTAPAAAPTSTPAPITTLPSRGGCPASWPDWACTTINAIGTIGGFDQKIAAPAAAAATGKPIGGTTNDIVPHVVSALDVQGSIITAGALLAGVLLLVLGAWSIVKD